MSNVLSFFWGLPGWLQLIVLFLVSVALGHVIQAAGWWLPVLASVLWAVAILGLLHRSGAVPRLSGARIVKDILDRLTNAAALEEMMKKKAPTSRSIDADELEKKLKAQVYGQAEVCTDVAQQVKLRFAKIRRTQPIGVFMLAGPPATGKTWFAKVLSECLYGPNSVLHIEMAQFSQAHTASQLFGQTKGYAGSDSYGLLTGALRTKSDRVVLLDEIEKASREVHTKFLSAWNDGFITEASTGEKVSTIDTIFILTTNAAQREIAALAHQYTGNRQAYSDACKEALKDHFAPEVLSRIDRVCPFLPLEGMDIARVVARQIETEVNGYGVEIEHIDPHVLFTSVEDAIKRKADPREIARMIEKRIAPEIIDFRDSCGVKRVRLIQDSLGAIQVIPA